MPGNAAGAICWAAVPSPRRKRQWEHRLTPSFAGKVIWPETCWQTKPVPQFACPLDQLADEPVSIPKLLRAYLAVGAKICGPPALDREFRTIDFLTLVDLQGLTPAARERFLG